MLRTTLLCFALAACSERPEMPTNEGSRAVAMVAPTAANDLVVAYTMEDKADRLPEVLAGEVPMDFRWISIVVDAANAQQVYAPDGLSVDMQSGAIGMTFSQVYQGVCNPATENHNTCWLHESFRAGEPGSSGHGQLRITSTNVYGAFDVTWEGLTDRFGPPTQWHRHGTISGYSATLLNGVKQ